MIDEQEVLLKCRILGVHVSASTQELKIARDRLARAYHPDKHNNAPDQAKQMISDKFKKIQNAYEYLVKNNEKVIDHFSHLEKFSLTSKSSSISKSHYVYSSIEGYT